MRRKWSFLFRILGLLLVCGCQKPAEVPDNKKVQVYTSMYPLEFFASKIGGEHVDVTNLVPPGTEPHDFELSAKKMAQLSKANVLVYNGAGFEDWIEKAVKNIDPNMTEVVNTSEGLELAKRNGRVDPHIWLDPEMAKGQARAIRDALEKVDTKHANDYERNYVNLAKQLEQLDHEYGEMVKKAGQKEFVVSHAAFHYLAERYDLKQIPVTGISPMEEPSPKELKNLINMVKNYKVKYIFFETLASNRLANVIKNEAGLEVLTLNPLEGLTKDELDKGEDYLSVMRKNKEHLAKALGAK